MRTKIKHFLLKTNSEMYHAPSVLNCNEELPIHTKKLERLEVYRKSQIVMVMKY